MGCNQGKKFDQDEAKREGAKLRLYAVGHLRKHADTYRDWFAVDVAENTQAWGDRAPPQTFDDFVTVLANAGVWIDNLSLTALAERTGVAIVTWIWDNNTSTWYRSVSAPWFDGEVARCARQQKPVVLILRDSHYRALLPATAEAECPSEWLLKNGVEAH